MHPTAFRCARGVQAAPGRWRAHDQAACHAEGGRWYLRPRIRRLGGLTAPLLLLHKARSTAGFCRLLRLPPQPQCVGPAHLQSKQTSLRASVRTHGIARRRPHGLGRSMGKQHLSFSGGPCRCGLARRRWAARGWGARPAAPPWAVQRSGIANNHSPRRSCGSRDNGNASAAISDSWAQSKDRNARSAAAQPSERYEGALRTWPWLQLWVLRSTTM